MSVCLVWKQLCFCHDVRSFDVLRCAFVFVSGTEGAKGWIVKMSPRGMCITRNAFDIVMRIYL